MVFIFGMKHLVVDQSMVFTLGHLGALWCNQGNISFPVDALDRADELVDVDRIFHTTQNLRLVFVVDLQPGETLHHEQLVAHGHARVMLLDVMEGHIILHKESLRALAFRPCHCVPLFERVQPQLLRGQSERLIHLLF